MTRLDLVTARSQEATSQHNLVQAEGNRRTAELALKRLLVSGPDDPLWQTTIDPTDHPDDQAQTIDLEAAVRRARFERRTDRAQARQQITANTRNLSVHPRPDAASRRSRRQLRGRGPWWPPSGSSRYPESGNFFNAPVTAVIPGSYADALSSMLAHDFPTWGSAVNVTCPIGSGSAKAEAARARLQMKQVETQLQQLEVQVVAEVTNAAILARNNYDEIQAAGLARELAEKKLDAEQKKFAAGLSTDYFVVQAQGSRRCPEYRAPGAGELPQVPGRLRARSANDLAIGRRDGALG